jgi:predicted cobalt transporter CbtA
MGLGDLLRRGVAAGAAAGVAISLFMWLLMEPVLRQALKVEDARMAASGDMEMEEPLVSRTGQVLGGMATEIIFSVIFGAVFAVVFTKVRHRLPAKTDYGRSVLLATLGFTVFVLIPTLKIPGNPPAVGNAATITQRTLLWVLTILGALALVLGAFALERLLTAKGMDAPLRRTVVAAASVVGLAVLLALVPDSPDTVPDDMGATIVWNFRILSVLQLGLMWIGIGMLFGLMVTRKATAVEESREAAAA